jgi:hypothetical protein
MTGELKRVESRQQARITYATARAYCSWPQRFFCYRICHTLQSGCHDLCERCAHGAEEEGWDDG